MIRSLELTEVPKQGESSVLTETEDAAARKAAAQREWTPIIEVGISMLAGVVETRDVLSSVWPKDESVSTLLPHLSCI